MEQKIGAVARLTRLEAAEQQLQDAANAALSLGNGGEAVAQQILSALKALKE